MVVFESWCHIRQATKDNPDRGLDSRSSEGKLEMCLGVQEEGERYRRRQLYLLWRQNEPSGQILQEIPLEITEGISCCWHCAPQVKPNVVLPGKRLVVTEGLKMGMSPTYKCIFLWLEVPEDLNNP